MKNNTIEIAGRQFRAIKNSTIEQDLYAMTHVRAAGLADLVMEPGENADQFAMRVLERTAGSGRTFMLLGAMMIPAELDDMQWTPAIAEQTADHLRKCTDPKDKAIIRQEVISLLVGFIQAGLTLYATSLKSSAASGPAE